MHRSSAATGLSVDASQNAGPKGADHERASASTPPSATHRRVTAAFEAAISDALQAATIVERAPTESVHAFRRATRRARALTSSMSAHFPTTVRLEIFSALRAAIRDTGAMRDRDVLPATLAGLPVTPGTEEARAALETALLIDRVRQRKPLSRVRQLAVAAARLGLLPDRFAAELVPALTDLQVAEGIARLARRARRSVRGSIERPSDVALAHRARKRVRTLAQAVDALLSVNAPAASVAQELARLSTKLGETLDLEMLATFAAGHARARSGDARDRLLEQVERRLKRRRPELLRRALHLLKRRRWKGSSPIFAPVLS